MILQTEAQECGLACLAMISGFFNFRIDMATLRGRYSISQKGASLAHIVNIAHKLKLSTRAVRLELDELSRLQLPCILHWDLNHFVVLKEVTRRGLVIHDPAIGARTIDLGVVGEHFTGVALEPAPAIDFVAADEVKKVSIAALMGRVTGLWQSLALVFAMAAALQILALVSPMFNQWVIDSVLVSGDTSLLNVLVIGFGLLLGIQTAISLARGWTMMYLSTHLSLQWTENVFAHLLRLPSSWFAKRHLGDVVSRFGAIGAIQSTLTGGFLSAVMDGIMAVATLAMMLIYSVTLGAIVIGAVLFYAALRFVSYGPLRQASQEALIIGAKEQSFFLESLRGTQAIKLFAKELDRQNRWLNLRVDTINRGIRTQKFMLWFGLASTAVAGVQNLLIFWFGAHLVMESKGAFTVGMLFAFSSYGSQFSGRMSSLIDRFMEFRMLSMHAERLADIVLSPIEPVVPDNANSSLLEPTIELINAGFRYSEADPWVFRNINLKIPAGQSVAFVGSSGCGKTTIVRVIVGLLPLTEGEIHYGGVPFKHIGSEAFRELVAVVMQDDQLLSGSILDNISFFDSNPNKELIFNCARMAAMHDDIGDMPMGYQTLTGDMGTTLSGGQKQRILIARALYRQPRVLVLDEATSHLDVERERQVNAAIHNLKITRICVAHRPETIAMAERVICMDEGAIVRDQAGPACVQNNAVVTACTPCA